MSRMDLAVGIDLGTTTSSCAAVVRGRARVITDRDGGRLVPSVVALTRHDTLVGREARARLAVDPENTISSFKRLLGLRGGDPAARVAIASAAFRLVEGPERALIVQTRWGDYSIPQIAAVVLERLLDNAERRLEVRPTRAVIGVPTSFDGRRREAVRVAGRIAGLREVRVIEEPTAAALAFGAARRYEGNFVVYDFGGGTIDVTVLRIEDGRIRVLGAAGDECLGGDDLDRALAFSAAEAFRVETGRNLWRDLAEWQRLLGASEDAKRRLSHDRRAEIRLRAVASTPSGVRDLVFNLDRRRFAQICGEKIEETIGITARALESAGLTVGDIGEVLLVGGSSFVRLVRSRVAEFFGRAPNVGADPIEAVALGAAIHAAAWSGERLPKIRPPRLLNVTPAALVLDACGERHRLLDRWEPLPACEERDITLDGGPEGCEVRLLELREDGEALVGTVRDVGIREARQRVGVEVALSHDVHSISLRVADPGSGSVVTERFLVGARSASNGSS